MSDLFGLPPASLPPGTEIGPYVLEAVIGVGGMAEVHKAHHSDTGEIVAIKVLHARFAKAPELIERFEREARTVSALKHEHVIRVLEVSTRAQRPYIVMEYLSGQTLFERLLTRGRMSTQTIATIMLPVISAVAAAHVRGIAHRDLKPENIILAQGDSGERPVLLDFGISKIFEGTQNSALTQAGQVVGTPFYMAPEQIRAEELDGRADEYSLGVILYELATSIRPFRAEQSVFVLMAEILLGQPQPPSQIEPSISAAFENVILRAMAVRREDRFENVEALGRALLPFATAEACRKWAPSFGVDPDQIELFPASVPLPTRIPSWPAAGPVDPSLATQPVLPMFGSRGDRVLHAHELKALPGLSELTEADLAAFCSVVAGLDVPTDAVLFTQGSLGDTCFFIVQGAIEISKELKGARTVLDTLGPGIFVGQDALVERTQRSVMARAVIDSVVIELGREGMARLLGFHDQVALKLLEMIAVTGIRQLRAGTRKLTKLFEVRMLGRNADGTEITASRPLEQLRAAVREWSVRIEDK